ncbi:MAG: class I SAM-dependent methyltransferase [Desulforhopalus sp.]
MKNSNIRLLLHRIRYTPFHPQWFAYRYEKLRYVETGKIAQGKILDIGCGRQVLPQYLKTSTTYVSLDFPETGKKLYHANPHIFGDASKLPFKDGSFDTVVMLEVLEHLPNPRTALQEACRVLKKNGQIILSTPFLYPIHDSPHDYQRWTLHGLDRILSFQGMTRRQHLTMGTPIESGVLLFNLSLAWSTLNSSIAGRFFLMCLSIILIPLFNILGYLVSSLSKVPVASPFAIGYLLVVQESKQ